jgi:hypothetical protein
LCEADISKIVRYLYDNLGVCKTFDLWVREINGMLPPNRRLSNKQMAQLFCVLRKKGENNKIQMKVIREDYQYTFC